MSGWRLPRELVVASAFVSRSPLIGRLRPCDCQLGRAAPLPPVHRATGQGLARRGLGLDQGGGGTSVAPRYPRHLGLLRGQRRTEPGGTGRGRRGARDNYLLVKLASSGVLRVHEPLLEATIKMAGTRAGSAVGSSQRRGRRALSGGQDRWPAIRSSAYLAGRPGCGIPAVSLRLGRHSRLGCHGWVVPGRWGRIPDGGDARAG
jgi:hypothetical protein